MKVLHINQSDKLGGAAIAGFRLHKQLLDQSFESRMLVGYSLKDAPEIYQVKGNRVVRQLSNTPFMYLGLNYINIINSFLIPQLDIFRDTDVVNLHNLHSGFFNYLSLDRITKKKATIYTLHDMWAFTGHCSYSFECDKWRSGCGKCPHKDTYPRIYLDNSKLEWKLKRWVYSKSNLCIVTPSNWLKNLVGSSILSRFPAHHIPNGIDLDTFKPRDRSLCRDALQISHKKFVVMFAAHNLNDPRKGATFIAESLLRLPAQLRSNTVLLTIGKGSIDGLDDSTVELVNLGYVENDDLKTLAYCAADVFLFPSHSDNYPITLQESTACGTPSVAFNVGGNSEIIIDHTTGLLIDQDHADKPVALAQALEELYNNEPKRSNMAAKCRQRALDEFDISTQARRYSELYQEQFERFSGE